MKSFFLYFFGEGTEQEFALFTPAHFAPILFMIAVILLLRRFGPRLQTSRWEGTVRCALAFLLLCSEMAYYWRLVAQPWLEPNAMNNLPIGVCGWAAIFCAFMLVGKVQGFFDISYFWLLSGSVFALLTPTPLNYAGPTRFRYYQFWGEHTLGYIAIFYMIFVHGMRPTFKSAVKSYVALAALSAFAYWVNTMIPGANYLYMARPEAAPSVLDILPPNFALRLTIMAAVITLMYAMAYLPWSLKDKKAAAKAKTECS